REDTPNARRSSLPSASQAEEQEGHPGRLAQLVQISTLAAHAPVLGLRLDDRRRADPAGLPHFPSAIRIPGEYALGQSVNRRTAPGYGPGSAFFSVLCNHHRL